LCCKNLGWTEELGLPTGRRERRVRSRGLPKNRGGTRSIGPRRDAKAGAGIAWSPTGRYLPPLPRVGRRCAGASPCRSGRMLRAMRYLLEAVGAGEHCLPKLVSPALPLGLPSTNTNGHTRLGSLRASSQGCARRVATGLLCHACILYQQLDCSQLFFSGHKFPRAASRLSRLL